MSHKPPTEFEKFRPSRSPLHILREHDFWSSECTTLNSNSLNCVHAMHVWQALIAFVQGLSEEISRGYARAIDQAEPHSAATCEP
jgi:hypothetical protein